MIIDKQRIENQLSQAKADKAEAMAMWNRADGVERVCNYWLAEMANELVKQRLAEQAGQSEEPQENDDGREEQ